MQRLSRLAEETLAAVQMQTLPSNIWQKAATGCCVYLSSNLQNVKGTGIITALTEVSSDAKAFYSLAFDLKKWQPSYLPAANIVLG